MQAKDNEQLHEWKECTEGEVMAISDIYINDLSDEDLALIFQNLPPYTRLLVSEVCLRWCAVSQSAWLDVTDLDLTPIPSGRIGAIIRLCPNLTTVFAEGQLLILDDLKSISLASFKALHLRGCSFFASDHAANCNTLPLFRTEYGQSMEELILHEHYLGVECCLSERYSQRLLPVSLTRLQLSGLSNLSFAECQESYLTELGKLRNLECLIFDVPDDYNFPARFNNLFSRALASLSNLRELLLPPAGFRHADYHDRSYRVMRHSDLAVAQAMKLPKLEILFLPNELRFVDQALMDLLLNHPTLRILVLPDVFCPSSTSANLHRSLFPNGFAAEPLPLLHVFVGEHASMVFSHYMDWPPIGLEVHPISAPFPEYLENEEVKSVFEGSWIAKQIADGAEFGYEFWNYDAGLCDSVGPEPEREPLHCKVQ